MSATCNGRYLFYGSEIYAPAVLRPVQAAIRRRGGEAAWFFDGPGASDLERDERLLRTTEEVLEFDPGAVLIPGNRVPEFFPGVKVEVFHGFSVGKRSEQEGHFRIRGWVDLYCTQGNTTTPRFQEVARRHGHFHVVETGWPKTDPLFRPDGTHERWREGWAVERPLVLYASTFTESLTSAPRLLETIGELSRSGPWNWLVTLHPKMQPSVVAAYRALEGPRLRFVETRDVLSAILAADVMLSDTSSVAFEFLLLLKPVVTFRNVRPGDYLIDVREPDEVRPAIETALGGDPLQLDRIREFATSIHPHRDGRSSERVLDAVDEFIEKYAGKLERKPMNLWRKLQMRRRLGYYR